MGRLEHEPTIQHFSHPHRLDLCGPQQTPAPAVCAGCRLPAASTSAYACGACNFFLHVYCAQMPHFISHPADPRHALALLATPAYDGGRFNCDACGKTGEGFSYHCGTCELDIHGLCAAMPLSLACPEHGHHPLSLTFVPPYQNMGFSCDLCGNAGTNQWLYRCAACEFDAHLVCATSQPRQPAPGTQQYAPQQRQLRQVTTVGIPSPFGGTQQNTTRGWSGNNFVPGIPAPASAGRSSTSLVDQAIQGAVQGAAEQAGASLLQMFLGGLG